MWGETPHCRPQTAKYLFHKKRRRGDETFRGKVLSWGTLAGGSPHKLRYILHFGQARIFSENVTLLSALRTFPLTGESPVPTRKFQSARMLRFVRRGQHPDAPSNFAQNKFSCAVRRPVRLRTSLTKTKTPSGDDGYVPKCVQIGDLRVCPRTKKQSTGLFFAHCGAPSCSTPHIPNQNKNTVGRRRCFCFGAADGSRTHLSSLGSLHSTDELQPRK